MIGIAFRFELGRYHATPWGSHVNDAAIEWPPSPWRILRSLYATSRSNLSLQPLSTEIDAALLQLAAAPPPRYELPAAAAAHTRHYVPSWQWSPSKHDTDRVLDGFLALDPESEVVAWWDTRLDRPKRAALDAAATALGHLGRSESVCTARIVDGPPPEAPTAAPLDPAGLSGEHDEIMTLLVPSSHDLDHLSVSVADLRRKRLLVPPGTEWVDYGVRRGKPIPAPAPSDSRPTLARFRVHGARPGIRDAVALGSFVRAALQRQFDRDREGITSTVFSGHDGGRPRVDQHRHAHYLATPDPDGRRIDHVVVWAPEGFGPPEVAALSRLTKLHLRDRPDPLQVVLTALGDHESLRLPMLVGPAPEWASLTPFGLVRHTKRRAGRAVDGPVDQIARELTLRGFPSPNAIELIKGPWLEHRRSRPGRPNLEAPRAVGARLSFEAPVSGPIALGALSHFGLGLFVPSR